MEEEEEGIVHFDPLEIFTFSLTAHDCETGL